MGKYKALKNIKYNGKYHGIGDVLELPDGLAARLPVEALPEPKPEKPKRKAPAKKAKK